MNVRSEKAEKCIQWFLVRHRRRPRVSDSLEKKSQCFGALWIFQLCHIPGVRKVRKTVVYFLCLETSKTEKILMCAKSWNAHHFKPVKFPQWNLSFDWRWWGCSGGKFSLIIMSNISQLEKLFHYIFSSQKDRKLKELTTEI